MGFRAPKAEVLSFYNIFWDLLGCQACGLLAEVATYPSCLAIRKRT